MKNHSSYIKHAQNLSTIGLPLYQAKDYETYIASSFKHNPAILQSYSNLIYGFIDSLEQFFLKKIIINPRLAIPGFHIFTSQAGKAYGGGVWHRDVFEHEILPETEEKYSATLLINSAESLFGIDYELQGLRKKFSHKQNYITVINSMLKHRVSSFSSKNEGLIRVTLQAHIWIYKDKGIIFW